MGKLARSFPLAFSPLSAQLDVGTVRAAVEHMEEKLREAPCPQGAPEGAGKVACVQTCMQGQTPFQGHFGKACEKAMSGWSRGFPERVAQLSVTPGACIPRNGRPLIFPFFAGVTGTGAQVEKCPWS